MYVFLTLDSNMDSEAAPRRHFMSEVLTRHFNFNSKKLLGRGMAFHRHRNMVQDQNFKNSLFDE